MHFIIKLIAEGFIILPILLAGYIFLTLNRRNKLLFSIKIVAGGVLSLALAFIASKLIHDPRPFVTGHFTPLVAHGNDNGFPSDHTLLASFLGWTLLQYNRKFGIIALVLAAMIGVARMAAGIHHSWDILGSFMLSGLATYIIMTAVHHFYHNKTVTQS